MIIRALVSVYDKTGIVDFCEELDKLGIEIISTGGTKKQLEDAGIKVKGVTELTGFPEMLDGRVKTLHPKVHAGILAARNNPNHKKAIAENGISLIDMVVVNLYPFTQAIKSKPDDVENAIENIDIGGPTMIRSAAKNYKDVTVIVDPRDYKKVLEELKKDNEVSLKTRKELMIKVFSETAKYNSAIDTYFSRKFISEEKMWLNFNKGVKLRYGENPHQKGTYYKDPESATEFNQLHGKELSFNNFGDIDAAAKISGEFGNECVCVIIKHANPCGVAIGTSTLEAYKKARETDPLSAFGGIISFSKEIDLDTALEINKAFVEVIISPGFSKDALNEFKKKKNLRLIQINKFPDMNKETDLKKISGGLIYQNSDSKTLKKEDLEFVTKTKPSNQEIEAMVFGWKVLKHVKSNAVIFISHDRTLGIGAGQMSRIDALKVAIMKAGTSKISLEGSVLASDAFFPFRDSVDESAKVGVKAIVQPGGSINDKESIEASNEHGISMALTGFRCFKH